MNINKKILLGLCFIFFCGVNLFSSLSEGFITGTKVAMYDGTSKNIEDVIVGDIVKSADVDFMTIEEGLVMEISSDYHLIVSQLSVGDFVYGI